MLLPLTLTFLQPLDKEGQPFILFPCPSFQILLHWLVGLLLLRPAERSEHVYTIRLPGSVEFRHVHQVEYTRLAFCDDALMHQLLAVAAFHLTCLNPS